MPGLGFDPGGRRWSHLFPTQTETSLVKGPVLGVASGTRVPWERRERRGKAGDASLRCPIPQAPDVTSGSSMSGS